jgi:hypothetical protein
MPFAYGKSAFPQPAKFGAQKHFLAPHFKHGCNYADILCLTIDARSPKWLDLLMITSSFALA